MQCTLCNCFIAYSFYIVIELNCMCCAISYSAGGGSAAGVFCASALCVRELVQRKRTEEIDEI